MQSYHGRSTARIYITALREVGSGDRNMCMYANLLCVCVYMAAAGDHFATRTRTCYAHIYTFTLYMDESLTYSVKHTYIISIVAQGCGLCSFSSAFATPPSPAFTATAYSHIIIRTCLHVCAPVCRCMSVCARLE